MREKINIFFGKIKATVQKAIVVIKKIIKFIKNYGFGIVNFLVLFLLYGVAYINVDTKGFVIGIGGLWMLFIAGRLLYKIWDNSLFEKKDETD